MKLLIIVAAAALSVFAQSASMETQFFPAGPWPLCRAGIAAGVACPAYQPGTEPGILRVRAAPASPAKAFAYRIGCDGRFLSGVMPRNEDADGWSSVVLNLGCVTAIGTVTELVERQ